MPGSSTEFILNTLKGKIWLAVSAMAILNCVFGLLAYLATSVLSTDPSITIFAAFFLSAVTTGTFGWWLSIEILRPVEKVALLAQTLERSPAASLPKTTGSSETDDILRTLHRNSQQLHNLINLMDDVAAGKTDTAVAPLQHSDRLSASFQKLVSKVTDSIDAKKDLISLQTAVTRLTSDVIPVKGGNLDVEIGDGFPETREISEVVKYLIGRLNELARQVHANTSSAKSAAIEVQRGFRVSVANDESKRSKLAKAAAALSDMPVRMQKISEEIADAVASAAKYASGVESGTRSVLECIDFLDSLRKQVNDAVRRIQKLQDKSLAIAPIAKAAEDLARRSNLLALNTSLGKNGSAGNPTSTTTLSEEISSLSARAEIITKEITSVNESIVREIGDVEGSLQSIAAEIPNITRNAAASGEVIGALEKCLGQLAELPAKLELLAGEQAGGRENSIRLLQAADPYGGSLELKLADAEQHISHLLRVIDALQESIVDFRLPPIEVYGSTKPALSLTNDFGELSESTLNTEHPALHGKN